MSARLNGAYPTANTNGLAGRDLPPASAPWVRNPSWPACSAPSGSNQIVGLYAVYPGDGVGNGGNFFAMTISGAYTINYGDGTTTNYTSGSTAYYEFNYSDVDLAGTDAPVTLTDAGDLVTRTAHGYTNDMVVRFYNIVTTTGLTANQPYYVINATANTFQVSATLGGSAVALTNDGTATLLPYKIATVTITPQVGSDLTSVNFLVKHNQTGLTDGYTTGWLDLAVASDDITSLTLGSSAATPAVRFNWLERVVINQLGGLTTMADLFRQCRALGSVTIADTGNTVTNMSNMFTLCASLTNVALSNTSAVTDMSSMFANCSSLVMPSLFNTASATTMASMFSNCVSLVSVPLFNTSAVTTMTSMFVNCYALTAVPLFNTASVNDMSSMFNMGTLGGSRLGSVPLFNTASVTTMASMFIGCSALTSVPLFNTASVTVMNNMFSSCRALKSVPLFNTASVTTMANMFQNCNSLTSVPLFNTASVTTMATMFQNCNSLQYIPLLNTASVTDMRLMFNGCASLQTIPLLNTGAVTDIQNTFAGCVSLSSIPALDVTGAFGLNTFTSCPSITRIEAKDFQFTFSVANCKLSSAALDEIYTNLPIAVGQTITVTGNYGTTGDNPVIATAKGWTVTG